MTGSDVAIICSTVVTVLGMLLAAWRSHLEHDDDDGPDHG